MPNEFNLGEYLDATEPKKLSEEFKSTIDDHTDEEYGTNYDGAETDAAEAIDRALEKTGPFGGPYKERED